MPNIIRASVRSLDDAGLWLDCNDGYSCRISVVSPRIIRVLFVRPGGLRLSKTWSVCPAALSSKQTSAVKEKETSAEITEETSTGSSNRGDADVPWQGLDRLNLQFESGLAKVTKGRFSSRLNLHRAVNEDNPATGSQSQQAEESNFVTVSGELVSVEVCLNPFGLSWFETKSPPSQSFEAESGSSKQADSSSRSSAAIPFARDRPSRPYFFSDHSFAFRHAMVRCPPDATRSCSCPPTCHCCCPPNPQAGAAATAAAAAAADSHPDVEAEPCHCPLRAVPPLSVASSASGNTPQPSNQGPISPAAPTSPAAAGCAADLGSTQRAAGDVFLGLGDKTGPLNLTGRHLRIAMRDALGFDPASGDPLYKHWPLLLVRGADSGVSYGLLYDNMSEGAMDLGCEHSNYFGPYRMYEATDGDLDMYLVYGPTMAQVRARVVKYSFIDTALLLLTMHVTTRCLMKS